MLLFFAINMQGLSNSKFVFFKGLQTGKLFKTSKILYTYFFSTLYKFQIDISLLLTDIHATNKMSFT